MYPYFMRTSFREKNEFITSTIETRSFNVITILFFNYIDFEYTFTTNFGIQQKPTTNHIQSINKLCKYSKKSKSNKKSTKEFTKSLSQTSMVLQEAMNHSIKQLSVTENLRRNHQQLNQYQQGQFHYHHYHHRHYQLKQRLSTTESSSVVTSLVNFQQVLSARSLTKRMLVSSTSFTAVDGIKSITYNDMKQQQQHHYHHHQQQINAATINAMITSSTTTNTTTITTLTSSLATMMSKSYQNVSDFFDMNFTPSVSEVLLAPTISTVIPTTTASSSSSSVITVSAGAASAEDEPSTGMIITTMNSSDSSGATDANNGTDDGLNSFYFYETEQFAVLWILFIVIVLGNSAVLVTLFLNKNRKSRMNFFIKQLAVADLLVGLLNVLTDIIWRITVSWRAGNIACKLIRFLQVCVTYASTYVLVALSIDRYDAITHPMNFSGSWQRARRLVGCAWVVSAIFSAPMLFLYEEKLIQGQTQCWIELGKPWRWQLYMSLVSATLFFFPALIITACYAIIVRTIWVKGAVFVPAERGRGCGNHASRRASSRGIIPRAKVKTVKMTFVIVIVFVLCWSPYIVFDLLQVFGQIPRTQTNIAIATFIQSLAPLNSAANPLIYCLFSTQVCRALRRIPPFRWIPWSCCCCCCYCCGYCKSQGRNSAPIRCTTVGQRLHNSCDSMRTLTTSLTMSRRSNNNCMRPARVVIVERPKTILAMSEV